MLHCVGYITTAITNDLKKKVQVNKSNQGIAPTPFDASPVHGQCEALVVHYPHHMWLRVRFSLSLLVGVTLRQWFVQRKPFSV